MCSENKNDDEKREPENYDGKTEKYDSRLIKDLGQYVLKAKTDGKGIVLLNIAGEIEGHESLGGNSKVSKYELILPLLALVQSDENIEGLLVLLNTVGGDVEAGLAIAEMIASIDKPKVCLVLGGGHSIGVPLAVSGDVTYIVPTATMVVHPIRINGTVLGVRQNYEYIERMQDRIISFTASHSRIKENELRDIMFNTRELTKDIGSVLIGEQAVKKGIIDNVGGINCAMNCLYDLINKKKNSTI